MPPTTTKTSTRSLKSWSIKVASILKSEQKTPRDQEKVWCDLKSFGYIEKNLGLGKKCTFIIKSVVVDIQKSFSWPSKNNQFQPQKVVLSLITPRYLSSKSILWLLGLPSKKSLKRPLPQTYHRNRLQGSKIIDLDIKSGHTPSLKPPPNPYKTQKPSP